MHAIREAEYPQDNKRTDDWSERYDSNSQSQDDWVSLAAPCKHANPQSRTDRDAQQQEK